MNNCFKNLQKECNKLSATVSGGESHFVITFAKVKGRGPANGFDFQKAYNDWIVEYAKLSYPNHKVTQTTEKAEFKYENSPASV